MRSVLPAVRDRLPAGSRSCRAPSIKEFGEGLRELAPNLAVRYKQRVVRVLPPDAMIETLTLLCDDLEHTRPGYQARARRLHGPDQSCALAADVAHHLALQCRGNS